MIMLICIFWENDGRLAGLVVHLIYIKINQDE
jgi:hypothetical protein